MKNALPFALVLCLILTSCVKQNIQVESPDGNIRLLLHINADKQLVYSVEYADSLVILESVLGFELSDGEEMGNNVRIRKVEHSRFDSVWSPVYGERSSYRDHYNLLMVSLENNQTKEEFSVAIRAYDEGVAFRYILPDRKGLEIVREKTEFTFPEEAVFWTSYRAQWPILKQSFEDISEECDRPLLAELNKKTYLAIGEAALVDFARMKFIPDAGGKHALVASLSGEVMADGGSTTPWRYVMVAESPARLLENNFMLLNLNEPNQINDPSWIKPGKVIREVTLTTQGGLACIDFAAKHGLQFIEFDAGWYGNQYTYEADAKTVTIDPKRSQGTLDLQKVIDYGKEKGIGVILYVNQRALETQLDEILPLYQSWGVAGLKYGFVNVGSQEWTSWLHEAVRKTADYQMMVDIHDEYRPTGYSRTYPNLMTQEGIRGDEESPRNGMVINTIFTRMIAGAGDQTNCYFAERVTETMGSHASQMAKAICVYSPWQFLYWYDRPEGSPGKMGGAGGSSKSTKFIPEIPDLDFFARLPAAWDDTRVLDGYPGKHVLIARRSGDDWFVGAVNGPNEMQYTIELDFLDEGRTYEAMIYTDDASLRTATNVKISHILVDKSTVISQNILPANGMAVIISPIEK